MEIYTRGDKQHICIYSKEEWHNMSLTDMLSAVNKAYLCNSIITVKLDDLTIEEMLNCPIVEIYTDKHGRWVDVVARIMYDTAVCEALEQRWGEPYYVCYQRNAKGTVLAYTKPLELLSKEVENGGCQSAIVNLIEMLHMGDNAYCDYEYGSKDCVRRLCGSAIPLCIKSLSMVIPDGKYILINE
jgi:hypothetical protein